MPDITLPLTDSQMLMLNWAAADRRTEVAVLIADSLTGVMSPLEQRFKKAHKAEASELFELLTPEDQVDILQTIKDRILSYPSPEPR